MSVTSSTFSHPSARRSSLAAEHFRVSTASSVSHTESRLQQPRQLFARAHNVGTSISPSGWVAAYSSKQIRLYNVKGANRNREISIETSFDIPMLSKHEEIRDAALSNDLIAVITHTRLLVYDEYRGSGGQVREPLHEQRIDQDGSWTPRSLAISQIGAPGNDTEATASIAVGGEGEGGVKIFRYRYTAGWNRQHDRIVLRCPRNNGAIKVVGFSPSRPDAIFGPMIYALTTGNRLYCWAISLSPRVGLSNRVDPSWQIDCNSSSNERAYRDEISTATFIISPTGRPYILCTVDHKPGSHLYPTFIVPIDMLQEDPQSLRQLMKPIPESAIGQSVLAGVASYNGYFLVVVEKGKKNNVFKLLSLQGAAGGGLTCAATRMQTWDARLKANRIDSSRISISIEEETAALELIAVDGQGHVVYSRISVPDMPKTRITHVTLRTAPPIAELPYNPKVRELSSDESSRHSTAASELAERVEIIPE
ncbi:hypothetical protein PtrSN002B_002361 [Pyrenophora tritici-repentis]|uniref:Uncharacterized protein n=1 Tax=Pyrenophora tritici-repentis TaxID=45151 RepID=A0A2W1GDW2_9PLEO|nr:hypothetical protein PtrV1_09015 [Pyrenophora tritici-repentis]KAF7441945.1 hypothetical protein A1F99_137970 [Pyrenophora tritici-repentis]KAF7567957.1 hypothetical protein PtrM4_125700 [Pyrenophora tritici-repentis]KAG9376775.1 hypothetical protein A1F94_012375 [Pyrenophora tritici-repentis]KAI0577307.1 hypothetical protein Alg130_08423 [Pyrenophora tritici-repentis]